MSDNQHQNQQIHAIVHGHVQGVSFRYYTLATASSLKLTGWVRNLPDRTVEVIAEGPTAQLESLVVFLRHGPTGARVTQLDVEWSAANGIYEDFTIQHGFG